jgi:cytochrome c biogenesis protein CcmG/thiol:disulfide interchange protein DsbE
VPGLDPAVYKGRVSVVNVWASRCVPCHDEAPLLTELANGKRLQLVGINYKDTPDNARRFLARYGSASSIVGVDGNGRAAIEWGRLWRAGDFRRGPRGDNCLQAGRAGHA